MRDSFELTREDLARVTSKLSEKERYVLGIGTVLDGAIWPGMVGTPDHYALLAELHRLRLVCVPDELVLKHRIVSVVEDPDYLEKMSLQVRPRVMKDHPRLLPFLVNMIRETLVRHAPLALEGRKLKARDGLRGTELDIFLAGMGYRLGEGARMQALRVLEAAGEVRSSKAFRWNALAPIWPPKDPVEARAHHRFCMLSMMDRVVAQRYVGMPNLLWLMGFNETASGRMAMGKRLAEGADTWLKSKSLTLEQARRGNEAEVVWVQIAVMIARRPVPKLPLPEWLRRELELTVMPATLVRLGQGEEGTQYFKRALTERAERWVMLERRRRRMERRRGISPGPLPKGLDIRWETLQRWRAFPSFESAELRRTIERGLVPAVMTRVRNLLQEALPAALSLRDIYEHALTCWPVEFHSMELVTRGCDMLLASFMAAETLIPGPERVLGEPTKIRAYKAIKLELSYPDLTPDYCKNLTEDLGMILQCLAEPDPEDPPFIETTRYYIPRDELGAFRKHMQQLRDEQMEGLSCPSDEPNSGELPAIAAIFSTIHRFPVIL